MADKHVLEQDGQQLDELLASIPNKQGLVLPAAAGNLAELGADGRLQDSGKTPEAFAPSGFGYGETTLQVPADSADETYETFCARIDAIIEKMPDRATKQLFAYPPEIWGQDRHVCVLSVSTSENASLETVSSFHNGAFRMQKSDGVWKPLEWINPPMVLGVEYRTTERYLGKPVYTKLVYFGALPNATSKAVGHGAENVQCVFDAYGQDGNGNSLGRNEVERVFGNTQNVIIVTTSDVSDVNAQVLIKYYKTTD